MDDKEKPKIEKISLSDEFQKEIKNRKKTPWVGITIVLLLGVVVFASLGIGTYQIFYKKDDVKQTDDTNKIQSRPTKSTTDSTQAKPATTTPTTTPKVTTPAPAATVYTVQAGDTLSGIAAKYNTSSKILADYNGISDPNSVLSIGQTIKIPN